MLSLCMVLMKLVFWFDLNWMICFFNVMNLCNVLIYEEVDNFLMVFKWIVCEMR